MITIIKWVCLMCPELSGNIPISLMRKQAQRGPVFDCGSLACAVQSPFRGMTVSMSWCKEARV